MTKLQHVKGCSLSSTLELIMPSVVSIYSEIKQRPNFTWWKLFLGIFVTLLSLLTEAIFLIPSLGSKQKVSVSTTTTVSKYRCSFLKNTQHKCKILQKMQNNYMYTIWYNCNIWSQLFVTIATCSASSHHSQEFSQLSKKPRKWRGRMLPTPPQIIHINQELTWKGLIGWSCNRLHWSCL